MHEHYNVCKHTHLECSETHLKRAGELIYLTSQGQRRAKCQACNKVRPGISIKRPSEAEQLESSNYNMLRADDPSPVLKRDRDDSDEERRTRSKS